MNATQSNQSIPSQYPANYMDQALSFEMVRNLCNGKGNAWSELGKFVLIIGMDQFKILFKALVDKAVNYIKDFNISKLSFNPISYIYALLKTILQASYTGFVSIKNMCKKNINVEEANILPMIKEIPFNTKAYYISTDIVLQTNFWECVQHVSFKENLNYTIDDTYNIVHVDNNTVTYSEQWKNVSISIPNTDTKILFKGIIGFQFEKKFNKCIIKSVNNIGTTLFINHDVDFEEFFSDFYGQTAITPTLHAFGSDCIIQEICAEIREYSMKLFSEKLLLKKEYLDSFNLFVNSQNQKPITSNANNIKYKPLSDNICHTNSLLFCIMLLNYEWKQAGFQYRAVLKNNPYKYKNAPNMLFGFPWYTDITKCKLIDVENVCKKVVDGLIKSISLLKDTDNYKNFVNYLCAINNLNPIYPSSSFTRITNLQSTYIALLSSNPTPQVDLFNFITTTSALEHKSSNDKIQTFDIKMEYKEEEQKIPNPEYNIYQTRLQELKELPDNELKNKLIVEFVATRPPEFISQMKYSKKITCTTINKVYKRLDRLYLSKKDSSKLTTVLESFRDDKEWLEDHCLPNKLCVLLYGEPGCGKSSTIETIGSFLQKDIYNLNLQSVRSNEDLGALWDYVTNKTKNGGCIVMEDIDASTNIVLARNEYTRNEDFATIEPLSPNETPLTLSYLLNILQGSHQRDNSVVVVTTNWIQKLDPAFTRHMRFDVTIDMKPADHHQILTIFKVYFPKRQVPEQLIKTIPEHKFTPAYFIDEFRQHIKNPDITDEEIFAPFLPHKN